MSMARLLRLVLMTSVFSTPLSFGVKAADLVLYSPEPIADQDVGLTLPAVSGINGKFELGGGVLNAPPTSAMLRGAASLSIPVGHSFGLQGDVAAQYSGSGALFGGALHAFTRDPSSYLLGVTAGVVRGPSGSLAAIGPEAELYLDRVSVEAWVGVGNLNYDDAALADLGGAFAIADVAYYVTDDWRLALGGSHLLGYNSLHLGTEYQFRDLGTPLSLTGDFRYAQDGAYTVTAGLKGYFGGEDKSLIDRHRQDDPPNRVLSLFSAVGSLLYAQAPGGQACAPTIGDFAVIEGNGCPPSDPEQFCIDNGYDGWISGGGPDGECFGTT